MKEYRGVVWPRDRDDFPGERVSYWADTPEQAVEQLKADYGEDVVFTLSNEEDANKPR